MKKETIFLIDYQRLYKAVGSANSKSVQRQASYLKGGAFQTFQMLCQFYGALLDKEVQWHDIDKDYHPELYMSATEIALKTGFTIKSIKDHMQIIKEARIICAENIYAATYKIVFPLKFYFKAKDIEYLG